MKRTGWLTALAVMTLSGGALVTESLVSCAGEAPAKPASDPKVFVDTSALKPAADFKLADLSGTVRSLGELRGKVVIVDFWATWCGPCRKGIPHFIDLYKTYRDKGVEVLGISLDTAGKKVVQDYATKQAINYPILIGNQDVVDAYGGVRGIPTAFVITQDGKIFRKYIGYRDKNVFESDLRALLGLAAGAGAPEPARGR